MPLTAIREFLKLEAAGGIVLMAAASLALLLANTPFSRLYEHLIGLPVSVQVGRLVLAKPLLLWVNDGLMAIFFLLVGLELKREILDGELSKPSQILLPAVAAIGGIVVPAAVYAYLNRGHPEMLDGWAIPAATDIAFALGVLSLLGSRVPTSLKILLTAIAVIDDLGAIVIIALFYTADLSVMHLVLAVVGLVALLTLNRAGVTRLAPYILVGIFLWVAVLKSGVHATLAGVALGLAVPLRATDAEGHSPLRHLEHILHPWVAFGVLPFFAFANAGVSFAGMSLGSVLNPVSLGIALGLVVGKQVGVFGAVSLASATGLARRPAATTWRQLYGLSALCGVGFTMSLFIGSLAFDEQPGLAATLRIGVLGGSLVSALVGYAVLRWAAPGQPGEHGTVSS